MSEFSEEKLKTGLSVEEAQRLRHAHAVGVTVDEQPDCIRYFTPTSEACATAP